MTATQNNSQTPRRANVLGVHSIDHFSFSVPDLSEAENFYANFGLLVKPNGEALDVFTKGSDHCWIKITKGDKKKLSYISFAAFDDDLPKFVELHKQQGIAAISAPAGADSDGLWFGDPGGVALQIKAAQRSAPTEKSVFDGSGGMLAARNAVGRSAAPRVNPRRLAHVAVFTPDVEVSIDFYQRALGLRLSDQSADAVAFLHGVHGSEHHLVALLGSAGAGLHHSSWDVGSVNEVGLGAMHMMEQGFDRGWGMGRHVLGSNYFHYVRDPWGSYAEYTADMDYIPADVDWQADNHPPPDSMYLWGPAVPEEFINNCELD